MLYLLSRSHDSFTIGTYPGRSIADPPAVFLEAVVANLKTAGTAPAEWFLFLTAMTSIFAEFSFSVA